MRILFTNDDGIEAEGISALVRRFSKKYEVIVAAPAEEQSGMSHAITVHKNIEIEPYEGFGKGVAAWKIGGTPTDCVKIYLEAVAKRNEWPDLIISGINHGANLGTDVLYSGTVGGALEGYLHGISALAVSLDKKSEVGFDRVATEMYEKLGWFFENSDGAFFFNVNFPVKLLGDEVKFRLSSLGHRDYVNALERHEEAGKYYYRIGGSIYDGENAPDSDVTRVGEGYVAVTHLRVDLTAMLTL